jgi:hypothetical protein
MQPQLPVHVVHQGLPIVPQLGLLMETAMLIELERIFRSLAPEFILVQVGGDAEC